MEGERDNMEGGREEREFQPRPNSIVAYSLQALVYKQSCGVRT